MKYLDIDRIKYKQAKYFLSSEDIAYYLDIEVEDWYRYLHIKWLPKSKIKKLCKLLKCEESEVLIKP